MMQAVKPSNKKGASFSPSGSGNSSSQTKQGGSNGKSIAQRVMDMSTNSPNATDALRQQQTSSNNSVENDHEVETITNRLSHVTASNISPVNSQTSSSNNVNSSSSSNNNNNNNNTCDVIRANSQSSLQLQQHQHQHQQRHQKHHDSSANVCISLDTRVPHPQKAEAFSYQPSAGQLASRARDHEEVSYYNDTSHLSPQDSAACLLEPKQVGGSLDNSSKPRALLSAASSAIRDQKLGNSTFHMGATSCQQLVQKQQQQQQQQRHNHMQQQHTHHHLGQLPLVPQQASLVQRPGPEQSHHHHHYDDVDTYDLHYNNALVIEKEAARLHQREPSAGAGSSRYQEIPDSVYDGNGGGGGGGEQDKSATEQDSTTCQHSSSAMSIVAGGGCGPSPKAKSAPATPCNVTPTAFHQNHQHPAGQTHKNPNTMPPDMRKNISSAAVGVNRGRLLPAISMPSPHATILVDPRQQQEYLERAELASREKDYKRAIELFSRCISSFAAAAATNQDKSLLKQCYIQRAEAHFQLAQYNEAIEDSMSARDLNPKWTKPYYLQGRSQFMIGRYADSLAVLSFGLTQTRGQDPQSEQLFEALVEAALKSKALFGKEFEQKFNRLKALGLDNRPFLVVSLLGQEMLASGHCEHAAITLESAIKLLASSNGSHPYSQQQQRKLKSSVLSSISTAFCMLRDYDKAIACMLDEREIERELENVPGQCRVLANLGHAYYKVRKFDDSLQVHREQLDLALKNNLPQQAYQALHAAGHVHAVKGDYLNAMQSHEHCVNLIQEPNWMAHDKRPYAQFRELLSVGYLHAQSNNLKGAEDRYIQASELLKSSQASNQVSQEQLVDGTIMVNFNLAYLALKRQTRDSLQKAKHYYTSVLEAAQTIKSDTSGGGGTGSSNKQRVRKRAMYEMRACHGLGQTCRLLRELGEARGWFEKQLRLAETLKNLVGQSQALCNLALIGLHSDQQKSWKLFEKNLQLVKDNKLLRAYALSYMGLAYAQRNRQRECKDFYEKSLSLFKELRYCKAEERTIEENIAATPI